MKNDGISNAAIPIIALTILVAVGIGTNLLIENQTIENIPENDGKTIEQIENIPENTEGVIRRMIKAINENNVELFQKCYFENSMDENLAKTIVMRYKKIIIENFSIVEEGYSSKLNREYKMTQLKLEIDEGKENLYMITENITTIEEDNKWKITDESLSECYSCDY